MVRRPSLERAAGAGCDRVPVGAIAGSGGPWLLGTAITLADVAVMPAIVRMADLGLASAWSDLPRVARLYHEIRAHAGYAPTYYPGSLLTERFPHLRKS